MPGTNLFPDLLAAVSAEESARAFAASAFIQLVRSGTATSCFLLFAPCLVLRLTRSFPIGGALRCDLLSLAGQVASIGIRRNWTGDGLGESPNV